jgi:hypothetical protein
MIYNVTYSDKNTVREINAAVGKPYGLIDNLRMRGIGSEPFIMVETSPNFEEFTHGLEEPKKCNIELRPKGIIVHFSRKRVNYVWPIPMHHLSVYQSGRIISIYGNTEFIKMKQKTQQKKGSPFIQKLMKHKSEWQSEMTSVPF